jgi:hypothetical protein
MKTGFFLVFFIVGLGISALLVGIITNKIQVQPYLRTLLCGSGFILLFIIVSAIMRGASRVSSTPVQYREKVETFTNEEILLPGIDVRQKNARAKINAYREIEAQNQHNLSGLQSLFGSKVSGISDKSILENAPDPGNVKDATDWIKRMLEDD